MHCTSWWSNVPVIHILISRSLTHKYQQIHPDILCTAQQMFTFFIYVIIRAPIVIQADFIYLFITSLAKEVMFLVALVCLWKTVLKKSYKRIGMKFYVWVLGSTMKNWLNCGGDLGILRWVKEQKSHHNSGGIPRSLCRYWSQFFFFFFFLGGGGGGGVVFHHQGSTFLQLAIWE